MSGSDTYEWDGEIICGPDTTDLYNTEPRRIYDLGFPVELEQVPATFCAVCLLWFVGPHDDTPGSESRPPTERGTHD